MTISTHLNILSSAAKRSADDGASGASPRPRPTVTVLQVLPALGGSGGVERGTVEIAGCISKRGWRSLVASSGGERVYQLQRAEAEHFELPLQSKNPFVMRANIKRLEALIREQGVDIVHARSRAPAWSAYFACRRAGVPFVTTFHGTYNTKGLGKRLYNSVMARGERVIAISRFIAGHLKQTYGVPSDRIRVVHRGVDLETFAQSKVSVERVVQLAQKWRLEEGLPIIMLPARLTRWKGQGLLVDAIQKMGRDDIRCVLVGADQGRVAYRKELETKIEAAGLGGVVRIVDHCDDMPAAYMLADVVVSASTDPEAFGRVVVEAQALGRPVVAPNHGGACETIVERQTGWLFTPGDANDLARVLGAVLNLDEDDRQALVNAEMASVQESFSKDAMCAKTIAVYEEVLAAHGKAASA
ncbi:MAG: glycosyltransferase family 4 protein [Alphaproteobacteria bacterium]|nr:glycosyltransferase family 4 protein [Alphaproteobacteria bacterium]